MRGKEGEYTVYKNAAAVDRLSLGDTSLAWRSLRRRLSASNEPAVTRVDAVVLADCIEQQRQLEMRNMVAGLGAGLLASLCFRGLPVGRARLMGAIVVGSCTASGVAAGAIIGSKKTLSRLAMLQTPLGASVRSMLFVRLAPEECVRSARLHEEVEARLARQRASRWGRGSSEFAFDNEADGFVDDGEDTDDEPRRGAVAELICSGKLWGNHVFA